MKSVTVIAAVIAGSTLLWTASAQTRELVYGSWVSPKHGINADALPVLFNGVKKDTNGAITWKLVAGGFGDKRDAWPSIVVSPNANYTGPTGQRHLPTVIVWDIRGRGFDNAQQGSRGPTHKA